MKKAYLLFSIILFFLTQTIFAVESTTGAIYKTWKTIEHVSIDIAGSNGYYYPQATIILTDGTKWKYVGSFENIEILRLWKKGDMVSLTSMLTFPSNVRFIFNNVHCYFDKGMRTVFDVSTKDAVVTITQKTTHSDSEDITLSDGSIWRIPHDNVLFWSKPLSHTWKIGDHILITGGCTTQRIYHMINLDEPKQWFGNIVHPLFCIKAADSIQKQPHMTKNKQRKRG